MNKATKVLGALLTSSLLLTGCANSSLTGDTYSRNEARKVQTVKYATVISSRPVVIEGRADGIVGTGAGAAIGGIAGSNVGKGSGSTVGAIIGAVAGGALGQYVEEKATRAQGQEITLRLQSGQVLSIVQEVENGQFFQAGQQVSLLQQRGTSRVVAR